MAQETEDAELIAAAALVIHEAVVMWAMQCRYGELPCDPNSPARQTLEAALKLRGVMSR